MHHIHPKNNIYSMIHICSAATVSIIIQIYSTYNRDIVFWQRNFDQPLILLFYAYGDDRQSMIYFTLFVDVNMLTKNLKILQKIWSFVRYICTKNFLNTSQHFSTFLKRICKKSIVKFLFWLVQCQHPLETSFDPSSFVPVCGVL